MESIYLDDDLTAIRDQTRRFVNEEVRPHGEQWEEDGVVPRRVLRKMGDIGFFGLRVPEEHGGVGLGALASAVFAEEVGRSTFGGFGATVLVHTDMASPHLRHAGSPRQIARYMPGILSGETITAIAVTEPDAGSDVAAIRTRAVRDGDGWRINGSKIFITNGVHGDVLFVAAKTDPDAGSAGISMFIVEKGTPGFEVSRPLRKYGWRCSDTGELAFDDCWIPAENLLGEVNAGFYSIMKNFQNERLALAAQAMGEAQEAVRLTLEYTQQRHAFGNPLFELGGIRQRMAMLQAKVEAGRHLVYHTAWEMEQGEDATKTVSMAKAFCAELVNEVLYTCQQFHGGAGYLMETPIARMAGDARLHPIGGGATEVMLEEIAKRS